MTIQETEKIYYDGEMLSMHTEPLYSYLKNSKKEIKVRGKRTNCHRGYLGVWLVENSRLYLTGLQCWIDKKLCGIEAIFPGAGKQVFASWFTGEIEIPHGQPSSYTRGMYGFTFKQYIVLRFVDGCMVSEPFIRDSNN